ncbi:hypothetical protein PTSG_11830 [Salpingoeca rosetta]|uniref:Uncharacterized protein n=1 Tax=Salpingoeca rosetta (strain ATCC 50818 / BSB-021) TaxID=946362 RepID=F2TZS6_SALR5|nr:uncharacterized protein PTSG_11830 [Salpingoeca rosetta]EGD79100.1 hypothetical protein PTSG_11830 [Salpingoeca rosetta]|eukprot:XP_004998056.1 hypothetical protein PTSG_11830 [Salpingoeca rosetta]
MTDAQQNFNKAGVPTLSFFFLIAMGAVLFYMIKSLTPRNAVSGRLALFVKGLQVACGLQVITGLFMVFSAAQNTGITLMIIPLLGIFALHSLDPNLLVLYSALQFYILSIISGLPDAFQAAGACTTKFGDNDYCKSGWRSFLTFLAVLYHFVSLVHALAHFYFFMTFHTGALEYTSPGGIYAPLVAEQPPQPTHKREREQVSWET